MHSNPDPVLPLRLAPRIHAAALEAVDPDCPAADLLRSFAPHPTARAGVTTMVALARASALAEALIDLDAELEDRIDAGIPPGALYGAVATLSHALGRPLPALRSRMSARISTVPHTFGRRTTALAYHRAAEVATLHAVALRQLEDAEVVPHVWPSLRHVLALGDMTPSIRHIGLPSFALLVPPIPVHLLPPPVELGGDGEAVATALAATPHLARLELVANRMGGPAAAARNWLWDFLARCLNGRDPSPIAAAEARRVVLDAYESVVVPAATALAATVDPT